jgi:ATP-dependent protease HslVU (ClpYQ) peptidase subunit
MGLAGDADDDRTLLHSLGRILNLEYSALRRAVLALAKL